MGEDLKVQDATIAQIEIYYIFVFISFVILLYRYRNKTFALYIVLIFYSGLISFLSSDLFNVYKIALTLTAVYWLIKTKSFRIERKARTVALSFLVFSLIFLLTSFFNGDYFTIIFSQYARYFIIFVFFLILIKYSEDDFFKQNFEKVIYDLLLVQILLSVAKFLIIGATESLVGSLTSQGGAAATTLPILGFIFLWLMRKGVLKSKDWIFVFGLIFIGFVSVKRAIWFIMPIVIGLMSFHVPKRKVSAKIAILLLVTVPLVFYFGVRLNSTLNKEHRIWGSFDLIYVLEYTETYSFGNKGTTVSGVGRGGATFLLYDNFVNGKFGSKEIFGSGLRYMFATDYEEFAELGLGIAHKGSATGVYQTMITNGYAGIAAFLIFAFSILLMTKNKRLRLVLIGLFAWEYLFYTGIILRDPALALLLIYIAICSDSNLSQVNEIRNSNLRNDID